MKTKICRNISFAKCGKTILFLKSKITKLPNSPNTFKTEILQMANSKGQIHQTNE